ncbi:Glycosylphosphatidylinositol (GPI) anchor assembly protein, partial [Ascosphaera pollenicola]
NGGYVNPPQEKRQFRDPHGDWWDKQDRRNFGEPVHEDNDILTVFSTEQYTHYKPPKAFFLFGCAVAVFASSCGVLAALAPEAPFAPRTWDNNLEKELGGPLAMTAKRPENDS